MSKILVIDNETKMCKLIRSALEIESHQVDMAFSGPEGLQKIKTEKYDIIITDLKMDKVDGLQIIAEAVKLSRRPEIILMTAYASQETALEALRLGAYDYLIKPFQMEELLARIERVNRQRIDEIAGPEAERDQTIPQVPNIIGKSNKMREVYGLVEKVAQSDATVLLRGESGTGKELVAEAIHALSKRARSEFVTINCAAVPENLLETELFGYEKGAFTGAGQRKTGLFEAADGGTIFLDEIGDMPPGIQAKLLRVLQSKEIIRVGGIEKKTVDVRVIAATHQNLEGMIAANTFRSDLFYRINIFPINLPPLRERKEDIPELTEFILSRLGNKSITAKAKFKLMDHDWPGNVRELQNVLERAVIIAGDTIDEAQLPDISSTRPGGLVKYEIPDGGLNLEDLEKNLLLAAIEKAGGNKSRAAELLGITRRKLYSMLKRFGIFNGSST